MRRYATAGAPHRPLYQPDHKPLPFSGQPRLAWCDVMILTFAARRHAEHAAALGPAAPDAARLIEADLAVIVRALGLKPPTAASLGHVGPRSPGVPSGGTDTSGRPDATDANVGQRGERVLPVANKRLTAAGTAALWD